MDDAANLFKIVDSEAGKTIGLYETHEAAREAAVRLSRAHPPIGDSLVVVTMNEKGTPLKFEQLHAKAAATTNVGHHMNRAVRALASHMPRSIRRVTG